MNTHLMINEHRGATTTRRGQTRPASDARYTTAYLPEEMDELFTDAEQAALARGETITHKSRFVTSTIVSMTALANAALNNAS